MENEDFEYGYQQGQKDVEQHMVHPEVINSINDQHIDEIHFLQDRITALQRENERLRDVLSKLVKWNEPELGNTIYKAMNSLSEICFEAKALLTKEKN